jgi:hypothetical protein
MPESQPEHPGTNHISVLEDHFLHGLIVDGQSGTAAYVANDIVSIRAGLDFKVQGCKPKTGTEGHIAGSGLTKRNAASREIKGVAALSYEFCHGSV